MIPPTEKQWDQHLAVHCAMCQRILESDETRFEAQVAGTWSLICEECAEMKEEEA